MDQENIILFDDDHWKSLLPLTYTRPIALLRIGILTIAEKWQRRIKSDVSYITQDHLAAKYPIKISDNNLVINARALPNDNLVELIVQLDMNEAILYKEELIAARLNKEQFDKLLDNERIEDLNGVDISNHEKYLHLIQRPYDIFKENGSEIAKDFKILTHNKRTQQIPYHTHPINPEHIFIEEGAEVLCSTLNATDGPIYIAKNATVMEGSHIRGPFGMCENAVLKMGAKVYGASTLGPYSKVGGEINNVVFQGYSNKGHDGFLGNSVIGEWCNLGADTNCSNLKNNYADVKLWDYTHSSFKTTGLQFCGLIMGDHSKAGINTMFNTGTVVGVSANIFGSGFPRNFIPSYSWGGSKGYMTYRIDKALEVAEKVMARRKVALMEEDRIILEYIFHETSSSRIWE